MDRDPNDLTDDVATYASVITALLDPEHFWYLNDTGATAGADVGFGSKALTLSGTPTRGVSLPYGLTGTRFDGANDFATIAASARASSTTFTILALLRPHYLSGADAFQAIVAQALGVGPGFYFKADTRTMAFVTVAGYVTGADLPALNYRELALVGVRVEAGAPTFLQNGLTYDGDTGNDLTIDTFTPDRVGGYSVVANRLSGDLAMVAYLPEVAISDEDFARIWSARYPCHTATLAVVNRALSHIGQSIALTNLSTDATAAGVQARLHYPSALESVLRDFVWPFAKRYATLTLVGGTSSVAFNSDWQYAYRAPDRMVRALRVVKEGQKLAFDPLPPPFCTAQDDLGTLIFTDTEDAELEYLTRPTCPALQGDVLFREALQWYLAGLLAPSLSKNDVTQEKAFGFYQLKLSQAKQSAAMEEVPQDQTGHDPDWIRDR
jgi:hypothetical protein